jgi:putative lysine transport system permease protein
MPMMLLSAPPTRSFFEWIAFYLTKYWPMFLDGTAIMLLLSLTGTIFGFVIGLAIGVVRTIPENPRRPFLLKVLIKIVNFLLAAYIEIFRGTPMMVQAMVIFYGIPALTGIHLPTIPAGILIVSINTGAYLAEIVRGGILSIDKGQFEAAHSLGMTHTQTMLNVVLPQAIRNILPAIGNEFVINIKDTSVLNVISVVELFFQSKSVAGIAYRTFEVFFITSVIYFILTFTVTRILRFIEKKMDGPDNFMIHGSQSVPEVEIGLRMGRTLTK